MYLKVMNTVSLLEIGSKKGAKMKERRKYIRVKARLYVGYKVLNISKMEGHCWSRDISVAGIGVIIKEKLSPATQLELRIGLQDKLKPLIVTARVFWQVENPQAVEEEKESYRTGMIFLDLDEVGKNRIDNFTSNFLKRANK